MSAEEKILLKEAIEGSVYIVPEEGNLFSIAHISGSFKTFPGFHIFFLAALIIFHRYYF